jgi:hypothetical protein
VGRSNEADVVIEVMRARLLKIIGKEQWPMAQVVDLGISAIEGQNFVVKI